MFKEKFIQNGHNKQNEQAGVENSKKTSASSAKETPINLLEYRPGSAAGRRIRKHLIERTGGKCSYCGREGQQLNVDHIVPRSKGGHSRIGNLTITCVKCNQKKADGKIERREEPIFFYPEK